MTKKTKTLLIILVTVLLITGIGVVVLATTELGKGTIFQKEVVPETTDEVKNPEEETSSKQEENPVTFITVEEGLHDDGYVYFNMTPEDLETQEAREATFQRLLSLIPEDYEHLNGQTPEEEVLRVMELNYMAYNAEKAAEECPYGYYIDEPNRLNEDLTISQEYAYHRVGTCYYEPGPGFSSNITGNVITTYTDYDNGDRERYDDTSQASGWTLEAFNKECDKIEQNEYASTWEITRTSTYFKAIDEHGRYVEFDYIGKYMKAYKVYYVNDELIKKWYEDPGVLTPEEYVKKYEGFKTNVIGY